MNMEIDTRDRARLLAVAILLAVFAAGTFAGAALTVALGDRGGRRIVKHEEHVRRAPGLPGGAEGVVFLKSPFDDQLGLDDEQSAQVERLMQEQRRKAEQLMGDMEPRMKALMDSTNAAIEAVLTPDQRERFRELQAERRDVIVRRFVTPPPAPMEPRIPAPPPE